MFGKGDVDEDDDIYAPYNSSNPSKTQESMDPIELFAPSIKPRRKPTKPSNSTPLSYLMNSGESSGATTVSNPSPKKTAYKFDSNSKVIKPSNKSLIDMNPTNNTTISSPPANSSHNQILNNTRSVSDLSESSTLKSNEPNNTAQSVKPKISISSNKTPLEIIDPRTVISPQAPRSFGAGVADVQQANVSQNNLNLSTLQSQINAIQQTIPISTQVPYQPQQQPAYNANDLLKMISAQTSVRPVTMYGGVPSQMPYLNLLRQQAAAPYAHQVPPYSGNVIYPQSMNPIFQRHNYPMFNNSNSNNNNIPINQPPQHNQLHIPISNAIIYQQRLKFIESIFTFINSILLNPGPPPQQQIEYLKSLLDSLLSPNQCPDTHTTPDKQNNGTIESSNETD